MLQAEKVSKVLYSLRERSQSAVGIHPSSALNQKLANLCSRILQFRLQRHDHQPDVVQPESRRGSLVPGGTSREQGKPHDRPLRAEEHQFPGPLLETRIRYSVGGT